MRNSSVSLFSSEILYILQDIQYIHVEWNKSKEKILLVTLKGPAGEKKLVKVFISIPCSFFRTADNWITNHVMLSEKTPQAIWKL